MENIVTTQIKHLDFFNPASGKTFGSVPVTTVEQVDQMAKELKAKSPVWAAKSLRERQQIIRKFQSLLVEKRDEITRTINQDCGKSRQDALIELFVSLDMISQYLSKSTKWLRPERVSSGLYFLKRSIVEHRPHGTVLIISPWNYPLTLSLPPVIAALLAGNTVVLKPSEVTAATGVLMEELFKSVPELSPYVMVAHGDGVVGAALVNAGLDFIFMTGSTATGRKIMASAANTLTPVALELGGKDAMIVLEDADLQKAAKWGTWGAFFNTGQTCMAVERVYVVGENYHKFVELALQETKKFESGYSTEKESRFSMGPVTDPRQAKIIDAHLEDALKKGARLLCGGKREGLFYDPMILVDVDHTMDLMKEESFGPFMPIVKVKDEHEAISLANDSKYGLGASVWSKNDAHAKRIANELQASSVIINDCIAQFGIPMLPFGGVKESGFGRVHGEQGLLQFTRPYSYAVGQPPMKWDIATILREPGKYYLADKLMRVLFAPQISEKIKALFAGKDN